MQIRPSYAGEAAGHSFKDVMAHAHTTLVTAAIIAIPVLIGQLIAAASRGSIYTAAMPYLTTLPVIVFLPVAIIRATFLYAGGSDPGVIGLLDLTTTWRLLSFLGTITLSALLKAAVFVVAFLPAIGVGIAAVSGAGGDFERVFSGPLVAVLLLAILVGLTVSIGLSILISLRFGLIGVVNVLEERSPLASFRRSRELLKGRAGDYFVLLLILFGVGVVAAIFLNGPGIFVSIRETTRGVRSGPFIRNLAPASAVVVAVSAYLTTIATQVINAAARTNYYLALRGEEVARQRLEGITPGLPGGSFGDGNVAGGGPYGQGQPDPEQQQQPSGQYQNPGDLSEQQHGDEG